MEVICMALCKNCNIQFHESLDKSYKWCPTCRNLARNKKHFELSLRSKYISYGDYYLKLQTINFCCECCRMPFKLPYESSKNVVIVLIEDGMCLVCPKCAGSISHYTKVPEEIKLKFYHIKCVMDYIAKNNLVNNS
jgi:hypothetical protein